jgi:hypothetical protein
MGRQAHQRARRLQRRADARLPRAKSLRWPVDQLLRPSSDLQRQRHGVLGLQPVEPERPRGAREGSLHPRPDRYPPKKHDDEKNLWWRETKEDQGNAWSSNADWCRAWTQVAEAFGWTILTPAQIDSIRGMAGRLPWQEGIEDCGLANMAIARHALRGLVEHTIVALDRETGVWLKARPDVVPVDGTEANDFKTTQAVTDKAIQKTLDDYRYDMQADLTAQCLLGAADIQLTSFALIFAMKGTPHACRAVEMKPSDLAEAQADNRVAIRTFAHCLDTGRWPGPGGVAGDAAYIERSSFSRERAANRRAFLEMELEAA